MPTEEQNLGNKVFGPLSILENGAQGSMFLAWDFCFFHKQFGVTEDWGEDIVEIVGDAPRQGAEGFHFLRLTKLFLQVFLRWSMSSGAERAYPSIGPGSHAASRFEFHHMFPSMSLVNWQYALVIERASGYLDKWHEGLPHCWGGW